MRHESNLGVARILLTTKMVAADAKKGVPVKEGQAKVLLQLSEL